ncbi:MAG: ferric reductase-like transmembrane domain-containing protein [Paracoccus sp. (in: a-proteobacteria)]|nr:ferric reductase-like transmembrane domain-containing protein [Paracoccus sp. (in: a-proteobacteria)]
MKTRALFWISLAVFALALPFLVLMAGTRPAGGGWLRDFSIGLGFGALAMAGMQFALTARFRRMTYPYGADIIYQFHRWMAWGLIALVAGHWLILYIWFHDDLGELNPLTARWELTSGRVAMGGFALLIGLSELRKWLRFEFGWWRITHAGLAVIAFVAALAHVTGVGEMTAGAGKRALMLGIMAGWLALILWVRVGKPFVQMRNPWRLVENRDEGGGVRSLTFAPMGRGPRPWNPGQFAWLTLGASPFGLREHPFTISSPPEDAPEITMSIKALGDDTKKIVEAKPGEIAYFDGPYGVFSIDRTPEAEGFVFVGGGVGITPFMSNLRSMKARGDARPVTLFFANKDWDEVPFRAELDDLQEALNLTLIHVIEEPPEGWEGETGQIDAKMLARHLPQSTRDWPHLLCGPVPMTGAVTEALISMGVSRWNIEKEIFEMV